MEYGINKQNKSPDRYQQATRLSGVSAKAGQVVGQETESDSSSE